MARPPAAMRPVQLRAAAASASAASGAGGGAGGGLSKAELAGRLQGQVRGVEWGRLRREGRRTDWGGTTPERPQVVLAPLTRGGHLPFRRLCADFGADVLWGEMAFAREMLRSAAAAAAAPFPPSSAEGRTKRA